MLKDDVFNFIQWYKNKYFESLINDYGYKVRVINLVDYTLYTNINLKLHLKLISGISTPSAYVRQKIKEYREVFIEYLKERNIKVRLNRYKDIIIDFESFKPYLTELKLRGVI